VEHLVPTVMDDIESEPFEIRTRYTLHATKTHLQHSVLDLAGCWTIKGQRNKHLHFASLEYVLIFSTTREQHCDTMMQVFSRPNYSGLRIRLEKLTILKSSIDHVGHIISGKKAKSGVTAFKPLFMLQPLRMDYQSQNFHRIIHVSKN
jgi:hypothetical protein